MCCSASLNVTYLFLDAVCLQTSLYVWSPVFMSLACVCVCVFGIGVVR
jgi:hypothetical protein